jgi:hypothetical protein
VAVMLGQHLRVSLAEHAGVMAHRNVGSMRRPPVLKRLRTGSDAGSDLVSGAAVRNERIDYRASYKSPPADHERFEAATTDKAPDSVR